MSQTQPLFCVDMGTTRSRVWVTEGGRIWARVEADFGVRDVALGETVVELHQRLGQMLTSATGKALEGGLSKVPRCAVGAGMMTSSRGVMEVPHVVAPADAMQLASNMQICALNAPGAPILYLVPGVRTGTLRNDVKSTLRADLMRGEEALCIGLQLTKRFSACRAVLNLGSHWKWIWIDNAGRIERSRTSMTGELIHAAQSQTLIASALPQSKPERLYPEWLALGTAEVAQSGLSRALFCVRLLEQSMYGSAEERLSFLYGAFIQSETMALEKSGCLEDVDTVCISGSPAVAGAWQKRLEDMGKRTYVLNETERDQAYLAGLQMIFGLAAEKTEHASTILAQAGVDDRK